MGTPESVLGGGVLPVRSLNLRLKGIKVRRWGSGISLTTSVLVLVVRPVPLVKRETVEPAVVDASSPIVMEVPVSEGVPPLPGLA